MTMRRLIDAFQKDDVLSVETGIETHLVKLKPGQLQTGARVATRDDGEYLTVSLTNPEGVLEFKSVDGLVYVEQGAEWYYLEGLEDAFQ